MALAALLLRWAQPLLQMLYYEMAFLKNSPPKNALCVQDMKHKSISKPFMFLFLKMKKQRIGKSHTAQRCCMVVLWIPVRSASLGHCSFCSHILSIAVLWESGRVNTSSLGVSALCWDGEPHSLENIR